MSDKKMTNLDKWAFVMLAPIMVVVGVGIYFAGRSNDQDYVVTDKGASKIAYHSIKNPADMHVMMFEDTVSFYPYIKVGDTITGGRHIDDKVAPSNYTTNHGTHQVITSVNGKSLYEWREIARRDSILRTMRQNQR